MNLTTFQPPEIRDANDSVIQAGTYGKNSALANVQNTGVLDYINNNLMWLYNNKMNKTEAQTLVLDSFGLVVKGGKLCCRYSK